MKILLLGPPCPKIEKRLAAMAYETTRTEEELTISWVKKRCFDFAISYRYKRIIKKEIIEYFCGNIINLHISYLPWNRGADPNLWSYLEKTPQGVSIHKIDEGIDTGDIILQKKIYINVETETLKTSYERLIFEIEELFINNLQQILLGEINAVSQKGKGTYHAVRDKEKYLGLLTENWETPVKALLGMANRQPDHLQH